MTNWTFNTYSFLCICTHGINVSTAFWVSWTWEVGITTHQHIHTHKHPPPSECSITLETEAWFICSQIKATEVERVEKIIPSKQEKKNKKNNNLSSPWRECYLWKPSQASLVYTQKSSMLKLNYYNFYTDTSPALCADTAHILDCELVAQHGSGLVHQDYSTVNEEGTKISDQLKECLNQSLVNPTQWGQQCSLYTATLCSAAYQQVAKVARKHCGLTGRSHSHTDAVTYSYKRFTWVWVPLCC